MSCVYRLQIVNNSLSNPVVISKVTVSYNCLPIISSRGFNGIRTGFGPPSLPFGSL